MIVDGRLFFVLGVSSVLANRFGSGSETKLLIDQDGGADDAMAIFLALLHEKYFNGPEVIGLTTVHGNVNESQVYINTQRILGVAERPDVPIYRGSKEALVLGYPSDVYFGYDGLGDHQNVSYDAIEADPMVAASALIKLAKKYEGELVIVTLAPLTNIALAIKLDPAFISRLKKIYIGAGNLYSEESKEPEFNALLDVESYQIVAQYATADKVAVVPFNKMMQSLPVTKDWRINKLGAIATKIMTAQNDFERVSLPQGNLWQLLDPMVISIALENNIIKNTATTNNSIILCGSQRGVNTNELTDNGGNMDMIYAADEEQYKAYLLKIFSADRN